MPGKMFSVKTTQYFVGFGRSCGRGAGETEYGVKSIPLGAMSGWWGCSAGQGRPGQVRAYSTGSFRSLADNARAAEWQDRPEDDGRLFYQKPSGSS